MNIFNIKTRKKKRIYIKSGYDYKINENIKGNKVYLFDDTFIQSLIKYIGQTITIYTVSGGESGSGFTGVLLDVKKNYIRILSQIASPPDCPLDSCCDDNENIKDINDYISLGTITDIPIDKIAAFVHNTI